MKALVILAAISILLPGIQLVQSSMLRMVYDKKDGNHWFTEEYQ